MSNSSIIGATPPPTGVIPDFTIGRLTSVQHEFILVSAITLSLATVAVAFRLYTRIRVIQSVGFDDLAATVALFLSAAFFGFCVHNFKFGFGRHLYDVVATSLSEYAHILVPTIVVYLWGPSFTKFSILWTYHRISPDRKFRWSLYIVAFATFTNALITSVISGVGCAANVKTNAKCINNLALANAIINLVIEFVIILIPIPLIHALNLPIRQKIALGFIFSGASFVIIVSIIRLTYVIALPNSTDTTWIEASTCVWSTFEINVGIICNCAVALKPFFRHYFPRFLNSSSYEPGSRDARHRPRNAFKNLNKEERRNSKDDVYALTRIETGTKKSVPPLSSNNSSVYPHDDSFSFSLAQKDQILVTSSYTVEENRRDIIETGSTEDIIPSSGRDRDRVRSSRAHT